MSIENTDGYTWLDDQLDQGWKDFVRENRQRNSRSNRRLFKILKQIKGDSFVHSLNQFSKINGGLPQIRVTRKPLGIRINDNRYSAITEVWIDQKQGSMYGPNTASGEIYIEVKENRWVYFPYATQ